MNIKGTKSVVAVDNDAYLELRRQQHTLETQSKLSQNTNRKLSFVEVLVKS